MEIGDTAVQITIEINFCPISKKFRWRLEWLQCNLATPHVAARTHIRAMEVRLYVLLHNPVF